LESTGEARQTNKFKTEDGKRIESREQREQRTEKVESRKIREQREQRAERAERAERIERPCSQRLTPPAASSGTSSNGGKLTCSYQGQ
jgi:hypothetical protein